LGGVIPAWSAGTRDHRGKNPNPPDKGGQTQGLSAARKTHSPHARPIPGYRARGPTQRSRRRPPPHKRGQRAKGLGPSKNGGGAPPTGPPLRNRPGGPPQKKNGGLPTQKRFSPRGGHHGANNPQTEFGRVSLQKFFPRKKSDTNILMGPWAFSREDRGG